MRLGVYSDFSYRRVGSDLFAELPFVLFLIELAKRFDRLVLIGRLDPAPGKFPYRVPASVEFVALPHYARLSSPRSAAGTTLASLRSFWRALEDVDCVWLLGPHPLALAFALLARTRGRGVALGIRQDFTRYARYRHPDRRSIQLAARVLELLFRGLGRRSSVIVVGPELARHYASAGRLLEVWISLVSERDILPASALAARRYDGELTALSVGRLEAEKNPLLLADILARLREHDSRWKLVVCGDGPMAEALATRLHDQGLDAAADLRGYVPVDGPLLDLYRSSHAFLHVSWTEGFPQVIIEAFAAGLPVVATAVGGVGEVAGEAALLVAAGDAGAAAEQLARLAGDPSLREALIAAGLAQVRAHTLESECRRVADFLRGGQPEPVLASPVGAATQDDA
jgi:glycosyltransferase involved in cell wall biosynthesis